MVTWTGKLAEAWSVQKKTNINACDTEEEDTSGKRTSATEGKRG